MSPESAGWAASTDHPKFDSIPRLIGEGIAAFQRRWPHVQSTNAEEPVFVLAAGWRAGSTLVQRMLMPPYLIWGEPYTHAGLIESLSDPLRCITDRWPEPHFFHSGEPLDKLAARFVANLYPPPETLLAAHEAWFDRLFAEPARRLGNSLWGAKYVTLTADHAVYLRWVFPRARFIFLYRNPYDAYRSYAARQKAGWKWFLRWPDKPVTVQVFGEHWKKLVSSFLAAGPLSGAVVLRYEDLLLHRWQPIEELLGRELSHDAIRNNPPDGGPPPLEFIPDLELAALEREVEPLASQLGYHSPAGRKPDASQKPRKAPANDPSRCVVLVPVGTHVEPGCERGLTELERRGYKVWRVRGYSAIDQGRNQMATDALSQGFEETMWIDSDVAFDPNDIERLRAHDVPLVCGIYPKKGKRELAVHVMPGTKELTFGKGGGLSEVLYAATGFLHVRREVYQEMQRRLSLPLCNLRFGAPTIPFFQPMTHPDGGGHWYLAEDFAFCQRARQCGYKILADTSIRLWHIGNYQYSWEEAGMETRRFATFHYQLGGAQKTNDRPPGDIGPAGETWKQLRQLFPWPAAAPSVPPHMTHGWLSPSTRKLLASAVRPETQLILELGSWLGLSTRFLLDKAPQAGLVAVDHWRGSVEHMGRADLAAILPVLYETFLVNCWRYRERLVPIRAATVEGMELVAKAGLAPDLIYIDADHQFEAVKADLATARSLFPRATIVGDDWDWDGVRKAVQSLSDAHTWPLEIDGTAWRITPPGQSKEQI